MKEFKTASGTIKIKEIIPLNTWKFPIEVNGRLKTIKKVLKKEPCVKDIIHIIFKEIVFLMENLQHNYQMNNGLLIPCDVKVVARK